MEGEKNKVPEVAGQQGLSDEALELLAEKELEEEIPLEKTNNRLYITSIIFSTFVFTIVGILFYIKLNYFKGDAKKVVEIKQEETVIQTPIAQTSVAKGDITVEVLNGSGITGEAKRIGNKIQDLGYKVTKTGNADRTDKTTILINKSLEGKLGTFLSDMKTLLGVESTSGYLEVSTASAQIILGD